MNIKPSDFYHLGETKLLDRLVKRESTPEPIKPRCSSNGFSYKRAIEWIAENDEPRENDLGVISDMISVLLIADLTYKEPDAVAKDVLAYRIKHKIVLKEKLKAKKE